MQLNMLNIAIVAVVSLLLGATAFAQRPAEALPLTAAATRPSMPGVETRADNWLIAMGVGFFDDPRLNPLPGNPLDALAVCEAFGGPDGCVPPVQMVLLIDDAALASRLPRALDGQVQIAEPTADRFREALTTVASRATPDAMIIVYISTHGFISNRTADHRDRNPAEARRHFFATKDSVLEDLRNCVSLDEANMLLASGRAKIRLVIVDACKSLDRDEGLSKGEFVGDKRIVSSMTPSFIEALKSPHGQVVLTSCSPGERSWAGGCDLADPAGASFPSTGSVYTHFLVRGLRNAIPDARGYVTVDALHGYLRKHVPECRRDQTPWFEVRIQGSETIGLARWVRQRERESRQNEIRRLASLLTLENIQAARTQLGDYVDEFGPDEFAAGTLQAIERQVRRAELVNEIDRALQARSGRGVEQTIKVLEDEAGGDEAIVELTREFRQRLVALRERVRSSVLVIGQVQRAGVSAPLVSLEGPILARLRQRHPALIFDSAAFLDEESQRTVLQAAINQDARSLRELLDARCRYVIAVTARISYLGGEPNTITGIRLQRYHITVSMLLVDVESQAVDNPAFEGDSNIAADRPTVDTEAQAIDQLLRRRNHEIVTKIVDRFGTWLPGKP